MSLNAASNHVGFYLTVVHPDFCDAALLSKDISPIQTLILARPRQKASENATDVALEGKERSDAVRA